jgi:FkbM family methyltransferase
MTEQDDRLTSMDQPYGTFAPGPIEKCVISITERMPDNWLGLRTAIALRRLVLAGLRDDRPLDIVRWGLRMRLYPCRNGCEKGLLFTPQMYESCELSTLAEQIEQAKRIGRQFVFVDIGANVGLFSFFVAARAGVHAKVLAVEPEPENLRRFRFNLASNRALPITVLDIALGPAAEEVSLIVNERDRGGTRVARSGDPIDARAVRVRSSSLLAALGSQHVDFISALKIDVEGHEPEILLPFFRDASESLWPQLVIIEDGRSGWRAELLSELQRHRYSLRTRSRLNLIFERM